jgi:hypothetical protein
VPKVPDVSPLHIGNLDYFMDWMKDLVEQEWHVSSKSRTEKEFELDQIRWMYLRLNENYRKDYRSFLDVRGASGNDEVLAKLIGCETNDLPDGETVAEILKDWFRFGWCISKPVDFAEEVLPKDVYFCVTQTLTNVLLKNQVLAKLVFNNLLKRIENQIDLGIEPNVNLIAIDLNSTKSPEKAVARAVETTMNKHGLNPLTMKDVPFDRFKTGAVIYELSKYECIDANEIAKRVFGDYSRNVDVKRILKIAAKRVAISPRLPLNLNP